MLRGMSTVTLLAQDFEGAKRWYADLLGFAPYFDQPWYAEFRVGDHQQELGILNAEFAADLGGVPAVDRPGRGCSSRCGSSGRGSRVRASWTRSATSWG